MLTSRMINGMADAVKETRLPLKMIARVSGITYQTLRNWLKNGEGWKQQIEEGKIKKGDLTTKQKREIELFEKLSVERNVKVKGYLDKIHEFAEKHEDIKAYQWLLKVEDPIFRDAYEEKEEGSKVQNVVVVNLFDGEAPQLLDDFIHGLVKDVKEEQGFIEVAGDREVS